MKHSANAAQVLGLEPQETLTAAQFLARIHPDDRAPFAFTMMAAIQHQANKPAPKKTKSNATPKHATSSVDQSRKSTGEPYTSLESASDPPTSSHGRSGGAPIRPPHKNLISNKNHNCNARLRTTGIGAGAFPKFVRRVARVAVSNGKR